MGQGFSASTKSCGRITPYNKFLYNLIGVVGSDNLNLAYSVYYVYLYVAWSAG